MQRVAITGITGFVGRHVAQALFERGTPVRGLVRSSAKARTLSQPGLELVEGSLSDEQALARLCANATCLVHCAGAVAAEDAKAFFRVNADGTKAVLTAARKAGVSNVVHVSSLAARAPELSAYAASKQQSEEVARQVCGGMSLYILRPPAVYGPGDRATLPLISALTRPVVVLPGRPNTRLSLIYARDLAAAVAVLALEEGIAPGTYEMSDGQPSGYSLADLVAIASEVTGRRQRLLYIPESLLSVPAWIGGAVSSFLHSPRMLTPGKVRELYHLDWVAQEPLLEHSGRWRPEVSFKEGLALTLAWYHEQGWLLWRKGSIGRDQQRSGAARS